MRISILFISVLILTAFQSSETPIQKADRCYRQTNQAMQQGKFRVHRSGDKSYCNGVLKGYYLPGSSVYSLLIDEDCGECACRKTSVYLENGEVVFVYGYCATHEKTQEYCPGFVKYPDERYWFSNGKVIRYQRGQKLFTGDTLQKIPEVIFEEECVQKRVAALPALKK
ncbi:MAG: hypothetical protein MUC87_14445 [Bacteroidia bacterium]|jgi:hypothetical protein|nr:hypothetical protein [Bacteroidia bacterium]